MRKPVTLVIAIVVVVGIVLFSSFLQPYKVETRSPSRLETQAIITLESGGSKLHVICDTNNGNLIYALRSAAIEIIPNSCEKKAR